MKNNVLAYYFFILIRHKKTTQQVTHGITKVNDRYRVRIQFNRKLINLGYFDTLEEAVKARKEAECKYFKS